MLTTDSWKTGTLGWSNRSTAVMQVRCLCYQPIRQASKWKTLAMAIVNLNWNIQQSMQCATIRLEKIACQSKVFVKLRWMISDWLSLLNLMPFLGIQLSVSDIIFWMRATQLPLIISSAGKSLIKATCPGKQDTNFTPWMNRLFGIDGIAPLGLDSQKTQNL